MTQNNLGAALANSGRAAAEKRPQAARRRRCRFSLRPRSLTKADLPQDWAMTQNNLGTALAELGTRSSGEEGGKLLEDAVPLIAPRSRSRTKADLPQVWAMTQNNLGIALAELGTRRGGERRGQVARRRRCRLSLRSGSSLPRPICLRIGP